MIKINIMYNTNHYPYVKGSKAIIKKAAKGFIATTFFPQFISGTLQENNSYDFDTLELARTFLKNLGVREV